MQNVRWSGGEGSCECFAQIHVTSSDKDETDCWASFDIGGIVECSSLGSVCDERTELGGKLWHVLLGWICRGISGRTSALTYVYGIGRASALAILKKAGIDGAIRVKDLSEDHIVKIREIIERDFQVEGDLKRTFDEHQAT